MTSRLDILRTTTEGGVEHISLKPGANKIRVVPGRKFKLHDPDGRLQAEDLRVIKVENDVVIEDIPVDGSEEKASVTLEGYYQVCSAADTCAISVDDGSEDGALLADVDTKALGAQSDGAFVLYDPNFQAPAAPVIEEFPIKPVLYGVGGAAVLGLALGGSGGGSDGAPNTGDIPLALKSGTAFNNRFPTISGTAQPGTEVQLRIDTDGDQRENVTYTTTADANGNWSVNLQTATPASGTLPASGLSDSNLLSVIGILNGVQGSLDVVTLTFDNVPPASAVITQVAEDGIISGAEKTAGVSVTGTSEANGSVELKLGDHTQLVAVDANGNWAATLASTDLPAADGQYTLTATALDAAGNRGPAATTPVTMNTSGTQPVIGTISGNDIVNAAEAGQPIALSGVAEAGATLVVSLGGVSQSVVANAQGNWSTSITLPATLADGRHVATVESTNAAGNKATATREYTLDKTAPAAPTGITSSDGNEITYAETANGTTISGRGEAGATVSVTWGNSTQTATVGSGGTWQVQFERGQMPIPADGTSAQTSVSVTQQDAAGNTSPAATQTLTLEGRPAAVTPTINSVTSDNTVDATEAASPVAITGTAAANASVTVTVGSVSQTVNANSSGAWSASLNLASLDNGSHTVQVSATTTSGAAPGTASHTFTVNKGSTTTTPETPSNPETPGTTDTPADPNTNTNTNTTTPTPTPSPSTDNTTTTTPGADANNTAPSTGGSTATPSGGTTSGDTAGGGTSGGSASGSDSASGGSGTQTPAPADSSASDAAGAAGSASSGTGAASGSSGATSGTGTDTGTGTDSGSSNTSDAPPNADAGGAANSAASDTANAGSTAGNATPTAETGSTAATPETTGTGTAAGTTDGAAAGSGGAAGSATSDAGTNTLTLRSLLSDSSATFESLAGGSGSSSSAGSTSTGASTGTSNSATVDSLLSSNPWDTAQTGI